MTILKKLLLRWKYVILITAFIRGSLLLFSLLLNQGNFAQTISSWANWDGAWYLDIAKNWYQPSGEQSVTIVFYPLYPLLINILSIFVHNLILSGLIISLLFTVMASVILYELTLLDFDNNTALKAVFFLNIFPTSYFLQAIYPESLFLTLSLVCIYFFRRKLFVKSGVAGMLTAMTRVNGLLLFPLLLMELKEIGKNIISLFLIPLGFLIYLAVNSYIFHDPFYFLNPLFSYWYKYLDWPWNGIKHAIGLLSIYQGDYLIAYYLEFLALIFLLIVGIISFLKIRKSYGVYVFLNLLLFTSTSFILSTPRYSLVIFPIYIVLARIKNIFLITTLSVLFILALIYFSYIFTQKRWAF